MKTTILKVFLILLGVTTVLNGLWMLFSSVTWFELIPAAMQDTGELNPHLAHDVGIAYLTVGLGAVWSALNLLQARAVMIGVALFMIGHALSHVGEMLFGQLPHSHWYIDLPLVFLPAIFLGILLIPSVWDGFLKKS